MTTTGAVDVWHRDCWDARTVPFVADAEATAPVELASLPVPSTPRRTRRALTAAASSLAIVLVGWTWSATHASTLSLAQVEFSVDEPMAFRESMTMRDDSPPLGRVLSLEEEFPLPTTGVGDIPAHVKTPSLTQWTHPVTATTELMSVTNRSRRFGAIRRGIERAECKAGHCGVDLDGPRGRPIVAVAAGVVIRIERRDQGADGRSGRYVRIQHDDGAITAYMHMDDVAAELRVGDRVAAAQYVGTLGATGVVSAAPHLHFSLEIPRRHWERGDQIETYYVDPAPFLVRAKVSPAPRLGRKPYDVCI